jgi:ABC-type polysaccharide/polyol phosphate export permease
MAAGRPIINTALDTAIPHAARRGIEVITVPLRDPEKLAEAINTLIRHPERRRRIGEAARRRARTKRRRAATRYAMPIFQEGAETVYRQAGASTLPAPTSQCATTGLLDAIRIAAALAWSDMRHQYVHSALEPFWMSILMAVVVAVLGGVVGHFFNGIPIARLPMLALSLTAWTFLNSVILDATTALQRSASLIEDRAPLVVVLLHCTFRHALFALHNACVPLIFWLFLTPRDITGVVAALPGLILFIACTLALSLVLDTLATRFRDLRPIIEFTLTLAFLSSPILWSLEMINQDSAFMCLNPLTHLFSVWREPLAPGNVAVTSVIYVLAYFAALALAIVVTFVHCAEPHSGSEAWPAFACATPTRLFALWRR